MAWILQSYRPPCCKLHLRNLDHMACYPSWTFHCSAWQGSTKDIFSKQNHNKQKTKLHWKVQVNSNRQDFTRSHNMTPTEPLALLPLILMPAWDQAQAVEPPTTQLRAAKPCCVHGRVPQWLHLKFRLLLPFR